MTKLSICIPTYKRLDFLKPMVESIPEKYQVCISDNGNFIPDDFFSRRNVRIKHIKDVIPMFNNWNSAINMVETEWFIIPGDDDIVMPEKLNYVEDVIERCSNCAYIAFSYDIVDEVGNITGGWSPEFTRVFDKIEGFKYIQRSVPFRWPAIVINTSKSRSIGNLDESFSFTASDSLYLQTMAIKYPIAVIDEKLGQYRVWENSFTNKRIFSKEWFDYLELWQQKLSKVIIEEKIEGIDVKKNHDLSICDNLLGAIHLNKGSRLKERLDFIKEVGWPKRIGITNSVRLLAAVVFG